MRWSPATMRRPPHCPPPTNHCSLPTMPLDLWLIDAFTDRPFAGNPAGVCLLEQPRPDEWMQALAREMNQAETAFLLPAGEVDLWGPATLASAHYLWEAKRLKPKETARFSTRSGALTARRDSGWITLDFPATPAQPCEPPPYLLDAFHATGAEVLQSKFDYLLVLDDPATVRILVPDWRLLRPLAAPAGAAHAPSGVAGVGFLSP